MSRAQLKKHLTALTKEQIIEVMLELYNARKETKEYPFIKHPERQHDVFSHK